MKVALKVIGGKNDGKEIVISISRFIIGRGETAHLRPASDLVSREHTAIEVKDGRVFIVDLNSRNGTFVNGNKIASSHEAENGDSLRVGRLQFEVVIDQVQAGTKKPKVTNVIEAAARTASTNPKPSLDDSITDWLLEAGEEDPSTSERELLKSAETIQLNFEDTTAISKEPEVETPPVESESQASESLTVFAKRGKSKPMKLPPIEKAKHASSTAAADDVLKKFFNRR
jgi:pSer/pThr/pTyr-binding forkhead associated (FHA) protein